MGVNMFTQCKNTLVTKEQLVTVIFRNKTCDQNNSRVYRQRSVETCQNCEIKLH